MKKILTKYSVYICLFFIVLISVYLRFNGLDSGPNWYVDEGSNAIMSWNLMHGKAELQGLKQTFIPHFPLFFIISGLSTLIFGKTIFALRILSAIYTILSTTTLFFIGKELKSKWVGIAISTVFCLMSEIMFLSRYGLALNLATLEVLLFILFLLKYSNTKLEKWLYASAIVSALIIFTDYFLWGTLVIYPILLWKKPMKLFLKIIAISFSLVGLFAILMLVIRGSWFLQDIQYYFIKRPLFSALNPIPGTDENVFYRLIKELRGWIKKYPPTFIGLIGLLLIQPKTNRLVVFTCFLSILLPIFMYGQISFTQRNQMMLFPFIAIGIVFFISKSYQTLNQAFFEKSQFKFILPFLFIILVLTIFRKDIQLACHIFASPKIITQSFTFNHTVRLIADYINKNARQEDYIIIQDNMSFLINAKTGDIFTATAYAGDYTEVISPDFIDKKRYTFDHSPEKARYYVDDTKMDQGWIIEHPSIVKILEQVEKWPEVYREGQFIVRQNPLIQNNY